MMSKHPIRDCILLGFTIGMIASYAQARDHVFIVGSSTVAPFAAKAMERFTKHTGEPSPIVESTGTGAGIRLFCAGTGYNTPDITNASRRMQPKEFRLCQENGVDKILEIQIGSDGIVLVGSRKEESVASRISQNLDTKILYLALSHKIQGELNPNELWSDIDPILPDVQIQVLGPPPSSGTRHAFEEQAILDGCRKHYENLDPDSHCDPQEIEIRRDGQWTDGSENDNVTVSKAVKNPEALAIAGYPYFLNRRHEIQASPIAGIHADLDTISNGTYPLARSLFLYVKHGHSQYIPGIRKYIQEFLSEEASGEFGYLADTGLTPLPEEVRESVREKFLQEIFLQEEDLKDH